MTPEQRRLALMQMIEAKRDPRVEAAEAEASRQNTIGNVGQAVEDMFRARSQAVGGQGTNRDFYNRFGARGDKGVTDAREARRNELKRMLMAKTMDDQDANLARESENRQYQRDYQVGRDAKGDEMAERRMKIMEDRNQAQGRASQNRYDLKMDAFGRSFKIDKLTGEVTPISKSEASQMSSGADSQQMDDENSPPSPREGETRQQYNARMQVWKSNQTKKDKPLTTSEYQARGFANRMDQAEDVFKKLGGEGFNRSDYSTSLKATLMPDFAKPAELRQQEQAERNFINATLRRESGAAIAESEFENAEKQYFPRAGDDPETIAQKARNRQAVLENMKAEARMGDAAPPSAPMEPKAPDTQMPDDKAPEFSAEDKAAYEWLMNNPNDPRAVEVVKKLHSKGLIKQ